MARLLIVDPALRGQTGHHYNLNRAVAEAAAELDLPCVVLGKGVGHEPLPGLTVLPVFPVDQYRVPVFGEFPDPGRRIARLEEVTEELLAVLRGVVTPVLRPGDRVLVHSPNASTVAAFGPWLTEVTATRDVRAAMVLNQSDFLNTDGTLNPQGEMYRRFFAAVREAPAERLAVGMDPGYFAPDMQKLAGPEWRPFRVPLFLPALLTRMAAAAPERRVGYFGHASRQKGTHLVPEIVRRLVARTAGTAAVTLHADFTFGRETWGGDLERVVADIAEAAALGPVRHHSGAIDSPVFYAELARCGVVTIPYAGFYRLQVSGVFREALAMGRTVVIPEDGNMARLARAEGFAAVTFPEMAADAIADACRAALDALPETLPRNRAAAEAWRARHSLRRFLDTLAAEGDGPLAERLGTPHLFA